MVPIDVASLTRADVGRWFQRGVTMLVGSWISSCGPFEPPGATLPDGSSWNSIISQQFFGPPTAGASSDGLEQLREDFRQLPFEALMQCYQDREELRSVLQGLYGGWAHNGIHELLVNNLAMRQIRSIITTNYDLGMDHCLRPEHKIAAIYDKKTFVDYGALRSSGYAPYYKIHGTVLDNCERSLVCDLGSEKRLIGWKLELFQECLHDRTLIIVGYSGRDFDICPDLSWRTTQAETIWFCRDPAELSPMAKQLIDRRGGTVVYGEGIKFLERLFGQEIDAESAINRDEPKLALNPCLLPDWRLRVLNWMAAGTLMLSHLDDFVGSDSEKYEFRAAACGHIGKYRDAVGMYARALRIPRASSEARAKLQLSMSGAWLIYGAYVRSWLTLLRARHRISTMLRTGSGYPSSLRRVKKLSLRLCRAHQDLLGRLHELEMVIYMRFMEIAQSFGLELIARHCRLSAGRPYGQARAILERAGSHERLQALQHNAERLGIAKSGGMALPIDPGYDNLGLTCMEVIAQRDRLRETPDPWTQRDRDKAEQCLKKAEYYGWRHEAWKFAWLLMWHSRERPRKDYKEQFQSNFRQVQMPLFASIFTLRRNCGIVDSSTLRRSGAIYLACISAAFRISRFRSHPKRMRVFAAGRTK